MALFTDGAISSIEELAGHDTQLLTVASVEGIDVSRKIALAQEEISVEVTGLLGRHSAPPALQQVVVTAAIKLWHAYRTLELVYRDAYHSQLNDRYAGKRDEYQTLVHWAYNHVIQSGLGIAADPVRRASPPQVMPSAGILEEGTYYVSVAWINGSGDEGVHFGLEVGHLSGRHSAPQVDAANHAVSLVVRARRPRAVSTSRAVTPRNGQVDGLGSVVWTPACRCSLSTR